MKLKINPVPTERSVFIMRGTELHLCNEPKQTKAFDYFAVDIFLTDNSEIKEGDWYVSLDHDLVVKAYLVPVVDHLRRVIASNLPNVGYPIDQKDYPEIVRLFNLGEDVEVEDEAYMTNGWVPTYNNPDNHNLDEPAEMDYRIKLSRSGCIVLKGELASFDLPPEPKKYSEHEMYLNMQYYMEYVQANDYITPEIWIKTRKHF